MAGPNIIEIQETDDLMSEDPKVLREGSSGTLYEVEMVPDEHLGMTERVIPNGGSYINAGHGE